MTTEHTTIIPETGVVLPDAQWGEAMPAVTTFAMAGERTAIEFFPVHRLDWRTGNNKTWNANGKVAANYAGWCIEQPQSDAMKLEDYELDDAIKALSEMNVLVRNELVSAAEEITIQHKVDGGGTHDVKYWKLAKATLFVPIRGIPPAGEERWGIAYAWRLNSKGKKESVMRFHVFIKELMEVGYNRPLLVSLSGHLTGYMRNALKVHNRTLNLVDSLRVARWQQRREEVEVNGGDFTEPKPEPVPYYAYGAPVICSVRTATVGTPPDTSEIYFPVVDMPRDLLRDALVAQRFLSATRITYDQALYLEEGNRPEETEKWSIEESKRIAGGADTDDTGGTYVGVDVDGNDVVMDIPAGLR